MGSDQSNVAQRLKIQDTALVLLSAVAIGAMLIKMPRDGFHLATDELTWNVAFIAYLISPAVLLLAAILLWNKPRFAYPVALLGSLLALQWLAWTELQNFATLNSWITLNLPDRYRLWDSGYVLWIKLKIVACLLLVGLFACASIRLTPSHWALRKEPLNQRTWPVLLLTLTFATTWFLLAVSPYRVPIIVDAIYPDIRILHVQKDGLNFEETSFAVYRDSRVFKSETRRQLFQYKFFGVSTEGRASKALQEQAVSLESTLPANRDMPKPLRSWRSEGWYVIGNHGIYAYTVGDSKCHHRNS